MSFLAPLYGLAALAVAVPVLLHLIKRQPKSRQSFSSLMFLMASPPTMVRRSRIDQWLLLLLRGLALAMLAFAFMRPFLRQSAQLQSPAAGQRWLLLLDTSASMHRPGLMEAVRREASKVLAQARPNDRVAVYSFHTRMAAILSFEESASLPAGALQDTVASRLQNLEPSWYATDLAGSLLEGVDLLQRQLASSGIDNATTDPLGRIFVISDLHQGSRLTELEGSNWPKDVSVDLRRLESTIPGNVSWSRLRQDESEAEDSAADPMRVRLVASSKIPPATMAIQWLDKQGRPLGKEARQVDLAPGSKWLEKWDSIPEGATGLSMTGDGVNFDNQLYLARETPSPRAILCIDQADAEPAQRMSYFLEKLDWNRPGQTNVTLSIRQSLESDGPLPPWPECSLLIAGHHLTPEDAQRLRPWMEQGGHVLWVLDRSAESAPGADGPAALRMQKVAQVWFAASECTVEEASVPSYAMLSEVDFQHPWLAVFGDPQFNDFSKIRYWKHRRLIFAQAQPRVLARFEDRDPAWLVQPMGRGQLWIMAGGWQPSQSQLALSSKFVPLMLSLFASSQPPSKRQSEYIVGETLVLEDQEQLFGPDGPIVLDGSQRSYAFPKPGHYRCSKTSGTTTAGSSAPKEHSIAVQLDPNECTVEPMDLDQLAQLGIPISNQPSVLAEIGPPRQMRASELEGRQSWWRWVMIGVLVVMGLESWMARSSAARTALPPQGA